MFSWPITFLVIAIIAGLLGFGDAGVAGGAAKLTFAIALVVLATTLLRGRSKTA